MNDGKKIQIEYEIRLTHGTFENLENLIKKICETHSEKHELRIKVILDF